MVEIPEYERPLTAEQRQQVAKWLLICMTAFSILVGSSAFTTNAMIIGPVLAIPGVPLVFLCFGHVPYRGDSVMLLIPMAPWLVLGLPIALWTALKLTGNRLLCSFSVAALLFSVWSSIVQIAFVFGT